MPHLGQGVGVSLQSRFRKRTASARSRICSARKTSFSKHFPPFLEHFACVAWYCTIRLGTIQIRNGSFFRSMGFLHRPTMGAALFQRQGRLSNAWRCGRSMPCPAFAIFIEIALPISNAASINRAAEQEAARYGATAQRAFSAAHDAFSRDGYAGWIPSEPRKTAAGSFLLP